MTLDEQLKAAIDAHGAWKRKLEAAIDSGAHDLRSSDVRDDHRCNFGQWLYGPTLDSSARTSKSYATCTVLHRRFHSAAADVVALVEAGDKTAAAKALNPGGPFASISSELMSAMMTWKSSQKR